MRARFTFGLAFLALPALAGPSDEVTPLPTPEAVAAELDALMEKTWKDAKVEPVPAANDAVFLRRASLDLQGVIPDESRVKAFLADKRADKRRELIKTLTQEESFARFTGLRWSYLLVGRDYLFKTLAYKKLMEMQARMKGEADADDKDEGYKDDGPVPPLVGWLEQRLRENKPWDETVRALIDADGAADENYATHYMIRHLRDGKATELAGSAMRLFQGIQIQCAQCHDHPYTAWKQEDFWGIAAFFSRAQVRRQKDLMAKDNKGPYEVFDREDGQIRMEAAEGEVGRMVLPRFATGKVIPPGKGVDRRAELGKMITAPDNPWFAKAMVNRFWWFMFGRGLSNPVDDLEVVSSSQPEALDRLARDFRESGCDVRRLMQVIAMTRAYQLASGGPTETRVAQLDVLARFPLRQLSAEQLFFSVLEATGTADTRTANPRERARLEKLKLGVLKQFIQTFSDDEAEEVVEEGTVPQALLMLNGPLSNDAVKARPGHPLYDRLFAMKDADERIDTVYLRAMGRMPSGDERRTIKTLLQHPDNKAAGAQANAWADVVWALINSPEFCLNH